MIIRYDFGEKLDLTRFQKQAIRQIGTMQRLIYHIFVKDYKLVIDIATPDDVTSHEVSISIFEIKRDAEGEITQAWQINPYIDTRFQDISSVMDLFEQDSMIAHYESNNVSKTIQDICLLIKLIHKINNLKVFL